jgi:DnaJ-class molecular chaperone
MPKYCEACRGTGRDDKRTRELGLKRGDGYVRCWTCNGGGLDPTEFYTWDLARARVQEDAP